MMGSNLIVVVIEYSSLQQKDVKKQICVLCLGKMPHGLSMTLQQMHLKL